MAMALNSVNDIFAVDGEIERVIGGPQAIQDCRSRILSYLGEWFLDRDFGVPYFDKVFIKPSDLGLIESLIKSTILLTPGIKTLVSFNLDFNTTVRLLTISFSAETDAGNVENATVNLEV